MSKTSLNSQSVSYHLSSLNLIAPPRQTTPQKLPKQSLKIHRIRTDIGYSVVNTRPVRTSIKTLKPKSLNNRKKHDQNSDSNILNSNVPNKTLLEIRNTKREIFFRKLSISEKNSNLKAMQEAVNSREKQLLFRITDFENSTALVAEQLKTRNSKVLNLEYHVSKKQHMMCKVEKEVERYKGKCYQKEGEIKVVNERISELCLLKEFVESVFGTDLGEMSTWKEEFERETTEDITIQSSASNSEKHHLAPERNIADIFGRKVSLRQRISTFMTEANANRKSSNAMAKVPITEEDILKMLRINSTVEQFCEKLSALEKTAHIIFHDLMSLEEEEQLLESNLAARTEDARKQLDQLTKDNQRLLQEEAVLKLEKDKREAAWKVISSKLNKELSLQETYTRKQQTASNLTNDYQTNTFSYAPPKVGKWKPNSLLCIEKICNSILAKLNYDMSIEGTILTKMKLIEHAAAHLSIESSIIKRHARSIWIRAYKEHSCFVRAKTKLINDEETAKAKKQSLEKFKAMKVMKSHSPNRKDVNRRFLVSFMSKRTKNVSDFADNDYGL